MNIASPKPNLVNGVDVNGVMDAIDRIAADPANGKVEFRVKSYWKNGTRSEHLVDSYSIGGQTVPRRFAIASDEPLELLGTNTAPNPQELLMSALNACMMVGYVAGAAVRGIKLEKLEIETEGALDLRGFLGVDEAVIPGYPVINMIVRIKGKRTGAQFREIHETVLKTSQNYFNVTKPIRVEAKLAVA